MGGHSLFFFFIAALGIAALFVTLATGFRPLASAMRINTFPQAHMPRSRGTRGLGEEDVAWKKLRIDGVASAEPSRESLEKSRHARADLLSADSDFDSEMFLQHAEMAYLLIKRALISGDPLPLRAYVHPSLYALTVAQIEREGPSRQVRASDLMVKRVFAQSVETGTAGDRIWVHFDVQTRGRQMTAQSGATADVTSASAGFGEQCLFVRNAGVRTVVTGGVFAQKCPACGAPLVLSSDACCFYCKEEISAGAHDWTLAAAVPVPYDDNDADVLIDDTLLEPEIGFAAIRTSDPAFSIDVFKERLASAFERLQTALGTGDLEKARPLMSPGFYLAWSMQVESTRAAGHTKAIDGIELSKLAPSSVRRGESFDDVTMRVDGMRVCFVLDESGELFSGTKQSVPFSEFWTFQRSAKAKTSTTHGALEWSCPNCEAPAAVDALGECVHCNSVVTSGGFDWVLARIVDAGATSALVRAGAA